TPTLLTDDHFAEALGDAQEAWREVVATAARLGIPAPGFSTALAYYDSLRAKRLPASLTQGQRDFFGAHTYRRTDREGSFHTLWGADRTEAEA
ncbi:NADP-dependent phosphogluconate dehydrogenase, partial [Actinomadura adrarensis]